MAQTVSTAEKYLAELRSSEETELTDVDQEILRELWRRKQKKYRDKKRQRSYTSRKGT